jgi:8-oxo-dGTP pyrophosphatase MutT (NUDIX family)
MSTLGVPKVVRKDFVAADGALAKPDAPIAAGIIFVAPDGDVLLLRRSSDEKNYGGHWGFPGGKAEGGETAEEAAVRECREEIKQDVSARALRPVDRLATPNGMAFTTFVNPAEDKFVPVLDAEHTGYCWASVDQLPGPLHPSVKRVLTDGLGVANDMKPEDWDSLRKNFAKWTREEQKEPEHAAANDRLALDYQSVRTYDVDGHLHVSRTPCSKANVCEYRGNEIPGSEALGLEPLKKYRMLRDPAELSRAAKTLNGKPVMLIHEGSSADQHPRELVVGAMGTDAEFVHPYLYNSMTVWDREGISGIENKSRCELSASYHYVAVMEPGEYQGAPYDGRMTNISFNHEALVPAGRAGADVLVADSKPAEETTPTQNGEVVMKSLLSRKGLYMAAGVGALMAPILAKDSKLDVGVLFDGVSARNLAQRKPQIIAALRAVPLAQDAKIEPVLLAFDAFEKEDVTEGCDADPSSGLPMNAEEMKAKAKDEAIAEEKKKAEDKKRAKDAKMMAAKDAKRKARDKAMDELKKSTGMDAKACAALDEVMGKLDGMDAQAEAAMENEEGDEGGGKAKDGQPEEKGMDRKAMDAAISVASETTRLSTIKTMREIAEAREFVEPYVGKVGLAFDSAEDVYKAALDGLKVDVAGVHPTALKSILLAQPKPGSENGVRELTHDAAIYEPSAASSSRLAGLERISNA